MITGNNEGQDSLTGQRDDCRAHTLERIQYGLDAMWRGDSKPAERVFDEIEAKHTFLKGRKSGN
jgi:hypothetical protein